MAPLATTNVTQCGRAATEASSHRKYWTLASGATAHDRRHCESLAAASVNVRREPGSWDACAFCHGRGMLYYPVRWDLNTTQEDIRLCSAPQSMLWRLRKGYVSPEGDRAAPTACRECTVLTTNRYSPPCVAREAHGIQSRGVVWARKMTADGRYARNCDDKCSGALGRRTIDY